MTTEASIIAEQGDWRFVATLEHGPDGNLIHNYIGKGRDLTIPAKYRNSESYCDHCNTVRRRNDTFICMTSVATGIR